MGLFGGGAPGQGMSWQEKLAILGATLQDAGAGLQGNQGQALAGLQKMKAEQAKRQQQQAFLQDVTQRVRGLPQRQVERALPNAEGQDISAAFSPQMETRAAVPALNINSPELAGLALQADQLGVDLGTMLDVMKAQQPDIRTVGGFTYNGKDASNANRYFPTLDKGQEPLYDGNGRVVAIRNMDGSVKAAAEMAAAVEGAKAQATSPYEFVNVPTADGAPAVMSKQQAAGGYFRGQSPADRIVSDAGATRVAEAPAKIAAATRQLAALDNMERLLPDVVAGFGADAQIQLHRALAAMGNDDSAKKVQATETFLNQGRILVSDIIKSFGANPTEGERKYAEKMSGADVQLNPETLQEGIRLHRERITRDLQTLAGGGSAPAATSSRREPPPVGAVVKGYTYIGGDPANPRSWQRAR